MTALLDAHLHFWDPRARHHDWLRVHPSLQRRFGRRTSTPRRSLEIFDRVGGGDSFASGFLYGLLELGDLRAAVEYGAAHGALTMTTPGDTSTTRLDEVRRLVQQPSARIMR
jgi:2-dehydro-3-deoxygluconokinase